MSSSLYFLHVSSLLKLIWRVIRPTAVLKYFRVRKKTGCIPLVLWHIIFATRNVVRAFHLTLIRLLALSEIPLYNLQTDLVILSGISLYNCSPAATTSIAYVLLRTFLDARCCEFIALIAAWLSTYSPLCQSTVEQD